MSVTTARHDEFKLTFRDVVSVFFYTKKVFILTFISVIAGAALIATLAKPVYQVSGRLVVKPRIDKPILFEADDASRMNLGTSVDSQSLNTVVHLLTSPDVLRDVVIRHGLADENDEQAILRQIGALRGSVKAEPLAVSNIIEVQMKGGDAEETAAQLSSLMDAYIAYHIRVNQVEQGRLQFFDEQADLYRKKYVRLSRDLAQARKQLNLASPDIQAGTELNIVRDLENRRSIVDGRVKELAEKNKYLKAAINNVKDKGIIGLPDKFNGNYPALIEMERSLAQLIINVQRAESDFVSGAKQVVDARDQYNNMRRKIVNYVSVIIEGLAMESASASEELAYIQEQIDTARNSVGQVSADAIILQRIEFERDLAEKNYRLYEIKKEESRINEEKDKSLFANVAVAARPTIPTSPWFPQRKLMIMTSIPMALILALAASIIAYSLDQTLRNPTDIHLRTKLRLLGSLDAV